MAFFCKIYGLILVPSIAFLIFGFLYLKNNYYIYDRSSYIQNMSPVITSSFNLIFNLQKERGMSAAYSSGAKNLDGLKKQKVIVNKMYEK